MQTMLLIGGLAVAAIGGATAIYGINKTKPKAKQSGGVIFGIGALMVVASLILGATSGQPAPQPQAVKIQCLDGQILPAEQCPPPPSTPDLEALLAEMLERTDADQSAGEPVRGIDEDEGSDEPQPADTDSGYSSCMEMVEANGGIVAVAGGSAEHWIEPDWAWGAYVYYDAGNRSIQLKDTTDDSWGHFDTPAGNNVHGDANGNVHANERASFACQAAHNHEA